MSNLQKIIQRIRCFFNRHEYTEARRFLLLREKCIHCPQERVLLPSGKWEKTLDIDPKPFDDWK